MDNEENILNNLEEGNEYISLHTEEKDYKLKMSEDGFQKHRSIAAIKEYKRTIPEKYKYDSKSKDPRSLEIASHTDSEFKDSKTGQDETIQPEEQSSQTLKPVPTQSTWTISGFADWLGLESAEKKDAASTTSYTSEEITFRNRKITIREDSDSDNLNKEGKIEPKTSGWFQSTLTDLLQYGSEKTGLGLLSKEKDTEVYDSSTVAGSIDAHTVLETREKGHRDSEQSDSEPNWFDLELSDVLTFGISRENKVKEEFSERERAGHDEEPSAPNAQTTLMDETMGGKTDETVTFGEQNKENYNETPQEILGSASTEDEKYEENENSDLNKTAASFTHLAHKNVKQDSKPGNQVMENINTKAVTKESEKTSDQSGWYGSIGFKMGISDNPPGPKSVDI